jgi:chromosome segregation ATPase
MARPGITLKDVGKACEQIIADGGRPSINGVKTTLGGGSPNNISMLLKQWRAANQPEKKSERVLPESVVLSITNEIEKCVTEEKASLEQGLSDITKEKDQLIQYCDKLDEALAEEQGSTAKAQEELQASVASGNEKDKLIESLKAGIEHEQSKTESQRVIAENNRVDLAKATIKLESSEKQVAGLPQLIKACSDAEKNAEIASAKETAVKEAFSRCEVEVALLSAKLKEHDAEMKALQARLAESMSETSDLRVENAIMCERLAGFEKE